jgi:hypothetical protein
LSDHITLDVVDADGAIREADAAIDDGTRADFLRRAGVAGAGFVAGGVLINGLIDPALAKISTHNRSKRNDVKILNYALTLEYLESEFYKAAVANNVAGSEPGTARFAQVVRDHEVAHVATLKKVLGSAAVKKPTFDFKDTVTNLAKFKATAQALEDTGVSAYAGQGPNILQRAVVQAALSIHSVEARHAAWIRFINGGGAAAAATSALPAPVSFDKAKSEKAVLKVVKGTGFITG